MYKISQIIVASENKVKVSAAREVLANYEFLMNLPTHALTVETSVRNQPLSLEETVHGAKQRAETAYHPSSLSIGLESGLMHIPTTDDEYMDVCICSVYDGKKHHIGMSCGFRIPNQVTRLIFDKGLDLNEAMKECGFTDNPKLGSSEGSIGVFTDGRLNRKDYCKQCITTALISIDQNQYFAEPSSQITVTRQFSKDRETVWSFLVNSPEWHPRSQDINSSEEGTHVEINGGTMIMQEVLEDREKYGFGYRMLNTPLPFDDYHAKVKVHDLDGKHCAVEWSSTFTPKGVSKKEAELLVQMIYEDGLKKLQTAICQPEQTQTS